MDPNASARILLVEDDDQVRAYVGSILRADGFEVIEAETGARGLECADEVGNDFDLLLSDMLLPELSGYDLAAELRRRKPDLKILFTTGYVEGEIVQKCVTELGASFLDKPFQPAELRARVRELVGSRQAARTH
jgi:two-component system cell cycle sensor histidine kinase/response regulator CckA